MKQKEQKGQGSTMFTPLRYGMKVEIAKGSRQLKIHLRKHRIILQDSVDYLGQMNLTKKRNNLHVSRRLNQNYILKSYIPPYLKVDMVQSKCSIYQV